MSDPTTPQYGERVKHVKEPTPVVPITELDVELAKVHLKRTIIRGIIGVLIVAVLISPLVIATLQHR